MSSIGAVGSNASLLQSLAPNPQAQSQQSRQQAIDDALKAAGVDPSKIPDLRTQIDAAAQQALQSKTGTPGQDRQAVMAAINDVLKQNGVDPAKFRSALDSQRAAHGHRGHHKGHKAGAVDPGVKPVGTASAPAAGATAVDGDPLPESAIGTPLPGGTLDEKA